MATATTKSEINLTTSAPTHEDAQIVLQLSQLAMTPSFEVGNSLLWSEQTPLSYDQFRAKYPRGSQDESAIYAVLKWHETVGTLVKNGLLNKGLVYDWLWITGTWDKCKGIAMGHRAETGSDEMWENFEALAEGQRAG
jgi:hypothetical protein